MNYFCFCKKKKYILMFFFRGFFPGFEKKKIFLGKKVSKNLVSFLSNLTIYPCSPVYRLELLQGGHLSCLDGAEREPNKQKHIYFLI